MLEASTAVLERPIGSPAARVNEARNTVRGRDITTALSSSLLRDVDESALLALIDECWVEVRAPADRLIEAGRSPAFICVVLSGRFGVQHADGPAGSHACLRAGDCAGEMSWIDHLDARASVVCTAQARLLVVPKDALWRAAERSHALAVNLLGVLSRCLRTGGDMTDPNPAGEQRPRTEAALDPLTHVHSRRWLENALPRLLVSNQRGDRPVCAILLDVDRFKVFNDVHGLAAGDSLLREIANTVRGSLRRNDLLARYGGGQFAVILPDTRVDSAKRLGERIRAAIEGLGVPSADSAARPRATVSLGIAERERGEHAPRLLRRADHALCAAKQAGQNCVRWA